MSSEINLTPMMKQYREIKAKYPDAILFFRLGDFYEMFFEDAKLASSILSIVLTKRGSKGPSGAGTEVPMCGIPFHSALNYITRLIKRGHKVAICEQVEDPKLAKGLVRREVVKLITPGTVIEDALLNGKANNYLAGLFVSGGKAGLAFADISTGEFYVTELDWTEPPEAALEEISRFLPSEALLPLSLEKTSPGFVLALKARGMLLNFTEDYNFDPEQAESRLKKHFKCASLEGYGINPESPALPAAGAVLEYLLESQKNSISHINRLIPYSATGHMVIDDATRRNLELTEKMTDGSSEGTLCGVLDRTVTAMGGRLMRRWIMEPLLLVDPINERLDAVSKLREDGIFRGELRKLLAGIIDLERAAGKIGCRSVNPKELIALKNSLRKLPELKAMLKDSGPVLLAKTAMHIDPLEAVSSEIANSINDEPPVSVKEGGIFKDGVNPELDKLRFASRGGKEWILAFQEKERKRTGISTLKVGFNSVFGYYIEVSKANISPVPADYARKQTLANAERYITPELKEYETLVLSSEEKIGGLELGLYNELRERIAAFIPSLQKNAGAAAAADTLAALAEAAAANNYNRPAVGESGSLSIKGGRHPVVELLVKGDFIPNDTELDTETRQLIILTGPNMAGKSTYLRQTALITLMAQIGSFVPAETAAIGIVDRIFTRVGASDNIALGHSTFMVEMIETANILNNATAKSLIILDEIGRGTATFDGISIAWAVAEYIATAGKLGAKTLFATHFYELTEMALTSPRVKNYNILVKEKNDEIIFLRKIVEGAADRSYGIQVARLAGLPGEVLERAKEILLNLEKANYDEEGRSRIGATGIISAQLSMFTESPSEKKPQKPAETPQVVKDLRALDLEGITPIQALNKLDELKKKADEK